MQVHWYHYVDAKAWPYGKRIHKGRTSCRNRKGKGNSRRNQPSNSRKLRIDTQTDKAVGKQTKPQGTACSELFQFISEYVHFYNLNTFRSKTALLLLNSGARPRKLILFYFRTLLFLSVIPDTIHFLFHTRDISFSWVQDFSS